MLPEEFHRRGSEGKRSRDSLVGSRRQEVSCHDQKAGEQMTDEAEQAVLNFDCYSGSSRDLGNLGWVSGICLVAFIWTVGMRANL